MPAAARLIAALTLLAPSLVGADEWDDPKPPEQLGMRREWFLPPPELAALEAALAANPIVVEQYGRKRVIPQEPAAPSPAPAPVAQPATVPSAPAWEGDDSQFNPQGPERSRASGGKLDQQAIKDTIHPHMGEVKFCFAREQARNPDLSGRVIVRFTIAESGTVTGSKIESSTVDNAAVDNCVAAAVRRWTFPTPKGGSVTVSWPFKVVALR